MEADVVVRAAILMVNPAAFPSEGGGVAFRLWPRDEPFEVLLFNADPFLAEYDAAIRAELGSSVSNVDEFNQDSRRRARDVIDRGITTIPDFLTAAECDSHIQESEKVGYASATIDTPDGPQRVESIRNNSRVIVDDVVLARALWARLRGYIPSFLDGRQAIGINERFRFYRYESLESFAGHTDGVFRRANGEESGLTFMVYLNDDFAGGETAFAKTLITPITGMAVVFRHDLLHEGRPIASGVKYVLRSDVMFNPIGRLGG